LGKQKERENAVRREAVKKGRTALIDIGPRKRKGSPRRWGRPRGEWDKDVDSEGKKKKRKGKPKEKLWRGEKSQKGRVAGKIS